MRLDENLSKKKVSRWIPFVMIGCILFGAVLGTLLVYWFQGDFHLDVLVGGVGAAFLLTMIEVIKRLVKKNDVPDMDERIARNVARFFAFASHIGMAILFIGLGIITLIGWESISIFPLWIFFFAYIWVVGIGVIIIKRW